MYHHSCWSHGQLFKQALETSGAPFSLGAATYGWSWAFQALPLGTMTSFGLLAGVADRRDGVDASGLLVLAGMLWLTYYSQLLPVYFAVRPRRVHTPQREGSPQQGRAHPTASSGPQTATSPKQRPRTVQCRTITSAAASGPACRTAGIWCTHMHPSRCQQHCSPSSHSLAAGTQAAAQ